MNPKAALVTGSAIRLGKEIALALAREGYDIAVHYHSSTQQAEDTVGEIRAVGVHCQMFQFDLRQADGIMEFMSLVHTAFPNLRVLVNSASGYSSGAIADTTLDVFDDQFGRNVRAPFFLTQAFATVCGSGDVINIIDNKIAFNQYEYAAYLLTKKTLVEFTKMAALEYAPALRVNGVAPGVVMPATTRSAEYVAWRVEGIPLKRQGEASHIGQALLSLLKNTFITGQILTVDGGESLTNTGKNATQYDPNKI